MTIFKIQIADGSTKKNYVDECLKDNRITTHIDFAKELIETLKPGDIGIVHKGSYAVCLVEILNKITDLKEVVGTTFGHDFKIKILQYYKDLPDSFTLKTQGKNVGHNGTYTILNKQSNGPVYSFINSWYDLIKAKMQQDDIIKVLNYKKQIILQGPPGTGKTYTAEAIAKQLTEIETVTDPSELINTFYKEFDPTNEAVIKYRKLHNDLRDKFYSLFPKESIKGLSLEQYCIGTGEKDNFCWWIERGLEPLGYYFPGTSKSYRVYWSKSKDEYSKNGSLKLIEDDVEAMQVVANNLHKLIGEKDYKNAAQFFGPSLILKILNTYYPFDYLPINSVNYITNALNLFGIEYKELDFVQKNQKLVELHNQKKQEFGVDVTLYEFTQFLFENFNLKEGEKINAQKVITKGAYEIIQFHPAYAYEDFVRGIVAEIENDIPSFNVKDKILIQFAQKAMDNPKGKFILIIDEINRANLPAVLGELIYALEYRGQPVNSLYELEGDRAIKLPNNLLIIGTMNTADRSVGHIDYAIRRRFSFIDVLPNASYVPDFAKDKFEQVAALFTNEFLASDFNIDDVQIGHSYFMGKEEDIDIKIKYEVVPILKEYVKDGVLNENANVKIEELLHA